MTKILSIDIATSSGVALLKDNNISVTNLKCPIDNLPSLFTFFDITGFLDGLDQVLLESFVYWNKVPNPKTTTQLVKRLGYVQYRFLELGFPVEMMHVGSVRKQIGIKGKSGEQKKEVNRQLREYTGFILSTDITDAIAMLLSFLGETSLSSIQKYHVEKIKNVTL